jgi:hypothetical protein
MLSDSQIANIVSAEEEQAIGYLGEGSEIQQNRATLLDYYNQKPFGDEIDGQSKFVTSDVMDVVEGMLPALLRLFTQGKHIGKFRSNTDGSDEECEKKTEYAHWVFSQCHDSTLILHDMFKDALLQYTGITKIYWDEKEESLHEKYQGVSGEELIALRIDKNFEITKIYETEKGLCVEGNRVNSTGRVKIDNIPPDELLLARRSRNFIAPPFIGQRTPKTRSDLLQMGFDKDAVDSLGKDDQEIDNTVKLARDHDLESGHDYNPTGDRSKDVIFLGEYYIYIDVDEDGISELWQVFMAEGKILEKKRVDDHPYCVAIPIPIPHRAIGTCPADQVADLQLLKATLVRQMLNNIYATNYNRMVVNDRVDLDDVLTPRAGGLVRVDGVGAIGDSIMPLVTSNQIGEILQSIEYTDTMREIRSGVTRYNQGLDTESLNKTATGFQGIRDMSQMRIEMIARIFSSTVKRMMEKIVELGSKYQDEQIQLRVHGKVLDIDPSAWRYKADCELSIGVGSGDRQEKVANLSYFYQQQKDLMQQGSPLVDSKKLYNTLDKVSAEVGLKGAESYFNNPERPEELIIAENEQLKRLLSQYEQNAQNPLAEAEMIKANAQLQLKELEAQVKILQEQLKASAKSADLDQKDRHHDDEMAVRLTEIEAQNKVNVAGSLI